MRNLVLFDIRHNLMVEDQLCVFSASFPFVISGLAVVAASFTNPIRRNKLFVQEDFAKSMFERYSSSLFLIKAFAVAMATTVLTTPPFFLIANKTFLIFSSKALNLSGRPRFFHTIFLAGDREFPLAFSFLLYLSRKVLTELSLRLRYWSLNFLTASKGP